MLAAELSSGGGTWRSVGAAEPREALRSRGCVTVRTALALLFLLPTPVTNSSLYHLATSLWPPLEAWDLYPSYMWPTSCQVHAAWWGVGFV